MKRAAVLRALAMLLGVTSSVRAADDPTPDMPPEIRRGPRPERDRELGTYGRAFTGVALGRGLRFNNPYRLSEPLGDSAESVSLSATYLDVAVGVALGDPFGFQHGALVHLSAALDGVPQEVITPDYLLQLRADSRWLLRAQLGLPVVMRPDVSMGLEAGAGTALFITPLTALSVDVVFNLFYGAAIDDVPVTMIPMLSAQLGVLLDYEFLP